MNEKVFFIPAKDGEEDKALSLKLKDLILSESLLDFIEENDMVAVKTHFGEGKRNGYVRPVFFSMLGEILYGKQSMPFLTETSTLYKGNRTNAIIHTAHAQNQGFGFENTGLPILMADGLYGDEEIEVDVPGKLYQKVKLASLIVKAQALVMVSHFTGHLASGFGGALKNMGMGCASRKGKMVQHSTAKPNIKSKACTLCGECARWCPEGAITMSEDSAIIDTGKCIGCGQCLAVCRFNAVAYNWKVTYEDLQKKIVEHAWAVDIVNKGKALYINVLTRISKDCDCLDGFDKISPDLGLTVSTDPVALDAASLDLVEKNAGALSQLCYDIPYRVQVDYAEEIGFGNPDYNLIEV